MKGKVVQHLFVDGLEGITIAGGVVRVELGTQGRISEKGGGQAQNSRLTMLPCASVNIPLEGFVGLAAHFQRFLDKLEKDGVIKREIKGAVASPNFN